MKTIDPTQDVKDLYTATAKIKEVTADRCTFLYVEDQGEPGGETFQNAIEKLYSVAYTTKFGLKKAGILDFKIPKLECVYFVPDPENTPKEQWKWRLMIRIPNDVTHAHLKDTRRLLKEKKGLDASPVRRINWREGRALQILHVGPYDKVSGAYSKLVDRAHELGYSPKGPGHEIYISDPRRVPREKLKTIVRMPIARPRPRYARGR